MGPTVMVTVSILVQPLLSVTTRVYVVVTVGNAVGFCRLGLLREEDGLQE
jgi:hypothetical protein